MTKYLYKGESRTNWYGMDLKPGSEHDLDGQMEERAKNSSEWALLEGGPITGSKPEVNEDDRLNDDRAYSTEETIKANRRGRKSKSSDADKT